MPSKESYKCCYVKYEKIGQGSSGTVYRGANLETGQIVAIKIIHIEDINICNAGIQSRSLDSIRREIRLLSQCDHPHITKYHGSCVVGQSLWIIMEYCGGGSLRQAIDKIALNNTDRTANNDAPDTCGEFGLEEDLILHIAKQILTAIVYLHKQNQILHRDIKAANILLSCQEGSAKLGDFGVSAYHKIRQSGKLVGSPYWMAPEVIKGSTYDWRADIWSFGITLFELATGKPPLNNLGSSEAMKRISQYNSPPKLQKDLHGRALRHIVKQCLRLDPNERPDAESLLKYLRANAAILKFGSSLTSLLSPKEKLLRLAQRIHEMSGSDETHVSPNVVSPLSDPGLHWDFEKIEDQSNNDNMFALSSGSTEEKLKSDDSIEPPQIDQFSSLDSLASNMNECKTDPSLAKHRSRRFAKSDSEMIILRRPKEMEKNSMELFSIESFPNFRKHHHSSGSSIDQIADFRNDCQLLTLEERDSLLTCMVYGNLVSHSWPIEELKAQLTNPSKIETELLRLYNVRPENPNILQVALGFIIRSRK